MSAGADRIAVLVRIDGRVQGVGYRAWTEQEAGSRCLSGWVRNRSDGSVEALFAGPATDVEAMVAACAKGPPVARVTSVHRAAGEMPVTTGFRTLPTR